MMEFTLDAAIKLAAPVLTGVFGLLAKIYLDAKPKLVCYMIHSIAITTRNQIDPNAQPIIVHTHSIAVRNAGKKSASNVRIGHHFLPDFQIYPSLIHEVIKGPDNTAEILIPTLVPGEQITIGYLYFPPQTFQNINNYCKSDEVLAKYLNVTPMVPASKIQLRTLWTLVFIGASSLVYWILTLLFIWAQSKN
ncbi:hypothetical protein [Pseudomonas gingeri]|uniref:Uncharacterized protein n=1 Tax=Pseudomonas gingeri TaxID=117681 RepID=A0A7Y7YJ05_9PSED|nr:hypothetical protein [Pseudomonas gingeri]NVZ78200.1 hypothetical protein [Pseudomonas gingeri]NWB32028.1 hypothetical protein [Pseudomonas gingeri]NWC37404.1 hypothetical protein [Pseudomonas gingeri]